MILGTGIDIIEVSRIRASHERFGERFLQRILRPAEIAYSLSHRDPAPFLAARFAAKEAVSKAFGTGIGSQLAWQDMEVGRGNPESRSSSCTTAERLCFAERAAVGIHLSLSHTNHYAAAMAILEG